MRVGRTLINTSATGLKSNVSSFQELEVYGLDHNKVLSIAFREILKNATVI